MTHIYIIFERDMKHKKQNINCYQNLIELFFIKTSKIQYLRRLTLVPHSLS